MRGDIAVPAIGILLVLALQVHLALIKSINWDEFYHFSEIHLRMRGEPLDFLQTPYTYLYGWVTGLPGSTIEHILTIRILLLPFELLLMGAIFASARRFADVPTSLVCTLAYLTAGFVFTQALSLRADVISASLMMTAIAIGLHRSLTVPTLALMAVLCMLATVSTIKASLYFPALVGLLYLRRADLPLSRLLIVAIAGATFLLAILLTAHPEAFTYLADKFGRAAARMFGGGWWPQGRYALRQLIAGLPFAMLLIGFIFWVAKGAAPRESKLVLGLFVLPVVWPIVYFNAYPYFYAFILPPVAVGLVQVVAMARTRYGMAPLVCLFALNAAILWAIEPREQLAVQQQFQSEVRSIFPRPVRYLDESGMIGEYPRAVPHYSSGWALANYRRAGLPEYRERVLADTVPLLIANSWALHNVFATSPRGERLLAADEAFLRSNFLPHAGMIHVAGKSIAANQRRDAELVATPGRYRLEGGSIRVDGTVLRPGQIVHLSRRAHNFENLSSSPARLRWADAGRPRASDIALEDLFTDF